MKLDYLASLLVAANLGTAGESIFIGSMPSDCTEGIMLRNPLSGIDIEHELPGFYKSDPQVVVRSQRFDTGESKAAAVIKALSITQTRKVLGPNSKPSMTINYVRARHLPIMYPRSDGNGREWSINFSACYVILE